MSKSDTVFLSHILDAINQIEIYITGLTYRQFAQDRLIQDGVIRQLEIIGEASRRLSEEFRAEHTDLPWQQIIGLRNRLIHAYFDISLGIIWDVVQTDIPPLKDEISGIMG